MKSMKVKVLAAVLPLVVSVTSVGAEEPGDKVTWENLGSFAASNARYVKGSVKGIVVDHHGLGCRFFKIEKPEEFAKEWTARGIVFLHPHTNPWCWMNDQAIAMTDEIVDVVIAHFGLAKDVKVLSTGGSMGGLGALVWTRYTKHHVVACAVNCPVCDLEYHTTERPDVIRSVKSAFGTAPDFAEAVRRHSPLRIAAELPDIPYFFVHADSDTAVNKGAHSDKLVPLLRSLGRKVTYVTSVGKNHCELTDESRAAWERARFAPFEERPEGSRDLRYFNVVPIQGGNVEFAAQEVKRQRALGVKAIAVSLSYHPQCTPAKNLLPIHAANFRRLKELLKDTDVEIGVLIQSTAGHGWNGKVQLSKEPWQHAVYADGKTNPRWCQLDPGFRAYVLEAFRSISREKPSFLLVDDDFGPKHNEGFCPLHVARYNAAAGVNKTADEWRKLANDGDQQDPLRRQMEESRRRVPIEFAKEIRAAIDSVDPTIRCGMCTPGAGAGFTKEVALALAGPNTRPFVRIFNAVYGQQHPTCFIRQLQHLRQLEGMMDGIGELVAEADTWPQNHWSEPARYYAAHLIFDVLYGLDGAKLWMSEFERPRDVASQARYEKVFRDELPKRQALYDLMQTRHPKFHGVTGVVNWGRDVCDSTRGGDWDHGTPVRAVFETFGFPCEITKTDVRDPRNVWALTRNSVKVMTDDEIRAVLGHRAYVDAIAAKELTKRGFANLLGVEATDGDENFYYNIEIPADGSDVLKLMSDSSSAFLKPVSDKVEVLSRFAYRDPFMKEPDVKAPGLTYFRNELGGEVAVAGWTFENEGFASWAKYTKVARKEQLVKVMDRLSGGLMPFVACENNHAISTWATLDDGSTLFTMTNLSVDDWKDLRVRLDAVPASAQLLADDGTWRPVAAEKTGEHEVTFRVGEVRCLVPQILLLRDQGLGIGDQGAGMDRVTWENLDRFAATNVKLVKGPVKGIAVDHHGLGCRFFRPEKPEEFGREWAARGVVFVHPHTNPWCWMNDQAVGLTDEILDAIIDHYKLPKDVKVLSTGGSMGGLGALVWARYTKHHVVACAVNCPVCDLEYHTTERPDVIRSVKSAFGTAPDFATAVRLHSPVRIAAELPDVPYFFVHADGDTAVSKGAHSDKLVPLLRSLGRKVEYVTSVGKNHCELTDESRAAWEKARFAPFTK